MKNEKLTAKTPLGVITTEHETDNEGNIIGFISTLHPAEGKPFPVARVYYDELAKGVYVAAHATGNELPTDVTFIEAAQDGSAGMNLDALRNDIYADANKAKPDITIEEESDTDILTYDRQQERDIAYHLVMPTADWLSSLLFIAPDVSNEWAELTGDKQTVVERILALDRNMLINLRHIIITTESEADLDAIVEHIGCEACEVCNFLNYVGMFWYTKSAVVINVEAIKDATDNLKKELHLDDKEYREELAIGFFCTLFHEIRHLGMENPYLSEYEYPDEEKQEACIEAWARSQTDAMIHDIKRVANSNN